jgi:hypothetical protein
MSDSLKLCINCAHHELAQGHEHWCNAESQDKVDLVTGQIHRTSTCCDYMRYDGDKSACHCRPEGLLFKPKEN